MLPQAKAQIILHYIGNLLLPRELTLEYQIIFSPDWVLYWRTLYNRAESLPLTLPTFLASFPLVFPQPLPFSSACGEKGIILLSPRSNSLAQHPQLKAGISLNIPLILSMVVLLQRPHQPSVCMQNQFASYILFSGKPHCQLLKGSILYSHPQHVA